MDEAKAEEMARAAIENHIDSCECANEGEVHTELSRLAATALEAVSAVSGIDEAIQVSKLCTEFLEKIRPEYTKEKPH